MGAETERNEPSFAVARKLATLLHHHWIGCEEYEPFHNSRKRKLVAA
jgi:hypothetical protein